MVDIYSPTVQDSISLLELDLYHEIMEYRATAGLAPIPMSLNLSATAGRHVLDTIENIWRAGLTLPEGTNLHSWSDAPYYSDHSDPDVMWYAPDRLGLSYPQAAFEISAAGYASVQAALTGWQNSPGHNNVIMNLDIWAGFEWQAIGIGAQITDDFSLIYNGRAYHVWFGAAVDPDGPPLIEGTGTDDSVQGTAFADNIETRAGDDLVYGGQGDDTVSGEAGADELYGGPGNDSVIGGDGMDTLGGSSGDDVLEGGGDADAIWGGTGNDSANGGAGNDTIGGFRGDDLLVGGLGEDELWGSFDNDTLRGEDGNDTLGGFDGNDSLEGGLGNDELWGASGADEAYGGAGDDQIGGGADNDFVDGGSGNDSLYGGLGDDTVLGGEGDDLIYGASGNDSLDGGTGNDTIYAGAGNDTVVYSDGADELQFFSATADRLELDDALWTGTLTAAQVVSQFGSTVGSDFVLDFGGGNSITLMGQGAVTGLESQIDIV
jgi:Ca2+-binding RTX toxin-like protein